MLRFTTKNEQTSVERLDYEVPFFTTEEEDKSLEKDVRGFADTELWLSLKDNDNDDNDTLEEKAEKRDLIVDYIVTDYNNENRLAKAITIGLHWNKPTSVPKEFIEVWDLVRKYARDYKGATTWDDDRKARFTAIKKSMVDCITSLIYTSGYGWNDHEYKLSSKDVNAFIDKVYTISVKNVKGVVGSKYTMVKCEKAFQYYMESINHSLGIRHEEGKVKEIQTF